MNQFQRKSLIGAFAVVASLSAPLAFAQSSDAAAATPNASSAQASPAAPTTAAPAAASPQKKSWSDVDADKDGKLSKTEAASVPALGQVFEQADSNADGALTAEEYKTYVAKVQAGKSGAKGG